MPRRKPGLRLPHDWPTVDGCEARAAGLTRYLAEPEALTPPGPDDTTPPALRPEEWQAHWRWQDKMASATHDPTPTPAQLARPVPVMLLLPEGLVRTLITRAEDATQQGRPTTATAVVRQAVAAYLERPGPPRRRRRS